jgi:ATP-dependent Clp protease ATP-binding subunit ClpA/predicted dehydrogenase
MDLQIQPPLPKKRDFRIGILGSGFVVNECHLPAYRKAGFNPVAIASRNRRNAEQTAQRHGIPKVHDSYEDLLNDPSIEVLDIAVAPQGQLELIKQACERKTVQGILAQKPLGVNYEEAVTAALLCKESGIVLSVNQNMRYDQSVRAAKTLLQNGVIGQPVFATIEMRGIPHWMPWQAELGWATLRVMSIHHLDCFRYWFGGPEGIYCSIRTDPRTTFRHADGICAYILEYANGLRCVGIDDPWTGPAKEGCPADIYLRWRIEGTNGLAIGDLGWCRDPYTTPSTIKFASKGDKEFHEPKWSESWFPDAFIGTMAQLLIALETGTEPAISAADNLKTMALVEAAYTSTQQFKSISLEKFKLPEELIASEIKTPGFFGRLAAKLAGGASHYGRDLALSNFTPRAQQVLALARNEADRFNDNFVFPEHILLGLIALGQGIAFDVLQKIGFSLEKVRTEVGKQAGTRGDTKRSGLMSYAPTVKRVLAEASEEAENLNHTYVGTEHILLALLREPEGTVLGVLKMLGVDPEQTRIRVLAELVPYLGNSTVNLAASESEESEFVGQSAQKPVASDNPPAKEQTMYRFTPRARQVLALARVEADRFHHGLLSPEHVLIGIMKLGNGPAFDGLARAGLDLAKVRAEVEHEVGTCPDQKSLGKISYAPRLERVLALAATEAKNLHHDLVGTEHILLALLREGDGVVPIVLKKLGVDLEKTRAELLQVMEKATGIPAASKGEKPGFLGKLFAKGTPAGGQPSQEAALRNFTPRAQQALALARKEADRFNHSFVGTEHLLLGLIALNQGVAVTVLQKLGLDLDSVRKEVEKQVGTGPDQKIIGNIPYTPRVKKVLALAAKEAKNLHHFYVGTEHILLGLMREGDGVAARVLKNFKVDIEQTRLEILKELDPTFAAVPGDAVTKACGESGTSTQPVSETSGEDDLSAQEAGPTPAAQKALRFAREEAERMKHHFIGPEHILIGLIAVGQGMAFDALLKLGFRLAEVQETIEKQVVVEGDQETPGQLDYTRGKAVLARAIEEAKALHQNFVGTEHILLGLLRQEDGLVPQILKDHGVDPAKARADVLKEIERIFGK